MYAGLPGGSNGGGPVGSLGLLIVIVATGAVVYGFVRLLFHVADMI